MIINNLYDVSLQIGNVDILDSNNASKVDCIIEESVYDHFPTCRITFLSSTEFMDENPIVDGTKIIITVQSEGFNIKEQWIFRVMKLSAIPSGADMLYSVNGIIDFYEFFRDPTKYSMKNNSSEVFKNIAKQNNISAIIYSSQDNQLWVPSQCNLYQWMNYMAQHAWASQQSAFFWCMNRNKVLWYADIDKLIYETKNMPIFLYGDTAVDDVDNKIIRYKNLLINADTGNENLFNRGYDGEVSHFDLLSYSTKKQNANKIRAVSEIINVNKELSAGLKRDMSQFDVGNHHANFFLAEAQNRRILSTFSTYINLACEFFVPIQLSQVCTIKGASHNSTAESVNSINIKYIVGKIVTRINSSTVNMNVELCSQGYNGKSLESY